jgi:hypothetical protein
MINHAQLIVEVGDMLLCCVCHFPVAISEELESGTVHNTLVSVEKVPYLE